MNDNEHVSTAEWAALFRGASDAELWSAIATATGVLASRNDASAIERGLNNIHAALLALNSQELPCAS